MNDTLKVGMVSHQAVSEQAFKPCMSKVRLCPDVAPAVQFASAYTFTL